MKEDDFRRMRERLNLNKKQFALLVGVDVRSVHRWESGAYKPTGTAKSLLVALWNTLGKLDDDERIRKLNADIERALEYGGLQSFIEKLLAPYVPKKIPTT